jgi:hypothetical protein
MRSGRGDGQLRPPGFPIRTSSDQSLVADSPRLIAGSNVLHRLLVPRHPPCALKNLAIYSADALQGSTKKCRQSSEEDARVHCAVLKIRTALGPATASAVRRPSPCGSPRSGALRHRRPVPSGPNSVLTHSPCLAARSIPPAKAGDVLTAAVHDDLSE